MIESFAAYRDCDLESVRRIINSTLKVVCIDQNIFDSDAVCFRKKPTLFECRRSPDASSLGRAVYEKISDALNAALVGRCTVFPVLRLSGPVLHVEDRGLWLIPRGDLQTWDQITKDKYLTSKWNSTTGSYPDSGSSCFAGIPYEYLVVSEDKGTELGCRFSSALKIRCILSVVFSVVRSKTEYRLAKVVATPPEYAFQFPDNSNPTSSVVESAIGQLLPYYANSSALDDSDVDEIENWFRAVAQLQPEQRGRIDKCAHFINRAMNSDDIESYISYFVALDALFGERGAVEESILRGVSALASELRAADKTPWLFALRNELVHGGSRYSGEWSRYHRYLKHFDSNPEDDIEAIAFAALRIAPTIIAHPTPRPPSVWCGLGGVLKRLRCGNGLD